MDLASETTISQLVMLQQATMAHPQTPVGVQQVHHSGVELLLLVVGTSDDYS